MGETNDSLAASMTETVWFVVVRRLAYSCQETLIASNAVKWEDCCCAEHDFNEKDGEFKPFFRIDFYLDAMMSPSLEATVEILRYIFVTFDTVASENFSPSALTYSYADNPTAERKPEGQITDTPQACLVSRASESQHSVPPLFGLREKFVPVSVWVSQSRNRRYLLKFTQRQMTYLSN